MPLHIGYSPKGEKVAESDDLQNLWWQMDAAGFGILSGAYAINADGVRISTSALWMRFGDKPSWVTL